MRTLARKRGRFARWNAGVVVVSLLGATATSHGDLKQEAEEAKRRALERRHGEHRQNPAMTHAQKGGDDQVEREAPAHPNAVPSTQTNEEAKLMGPPVPGPDLRKRMIESHNWEEQFRQAGVVNDDLQIGLGLSNKAYRHGAQYYLYLGLRNLASARRTLEEMPACRSLARVEALVLRVVSDNGTELVLPNRFRDTMHVHAHPPVVVDANADLVDLLSFTEFVMTSSRLFDLLRVSRTLTVTVEVPSLGLTSNARTIDLE